MKSVVARWMSVIAAVAAAAPARGSPGQLDGSRWTRRVILLLACGGVVAAASVLATLLAVAEFHHVYFNHHNLPDVGPFTRCEFPTIGHVYDADGRPLIELAREYREIARYEDIPPIVRDAILAAVGKPGTTNEFRDAIFVGSTYGPDGVTAAVRIGFDDNRSLGSRETGGRLALPVFQELMLAVYRDKIVGAAPAFPARMEARITAPLLPPTPPSAAEAEGDSVASLFSTPRWRASPAALGWLPVHGPNVQTPIAPPFARLARRGVL